MKSSRTNRVLIMILGLLACVIIIFAGGFRIEVVKKELGTEASAKGKQSDTEQSTTYLSSPTEAIPGSSSSVTFECPDYKVIISEAGDDQDQQPGSFVRLVNHYFRTLVRSLIRSNAP
jgi:hypothetical protein